MSKTLKTILISGASLLAIASVGTNINPSFNHVSASRYSYRYLPRRTRKEVNSFYYYYKTPAIRHSSRFIKNFYKNGARKIYNFEKRLASENRNIRHMNWLIKRHKHNHRYVRQLRKRIRRINVQKAVTSQSRYELLYAEHGTYGNYKRMYNNRKRKENTPTPREAVNSQIAHYENLGKRDANNLFSSVENYDEEHHMETRKMGDLENNFYDEGFEDGAKSNDVSKYEADNVLSAYENYHIENGASNEDYDKGWGYGLYGNTDENLTDSPEASRDSFDKGWKEGDIVNNYGAPIGSQNDYNQFMYQVHHHALYALQSKIGLAHVHSLFGTNSYENPDYN